MSLTRTPARSSEWAGASGDISSAICSRFFARCPASSVLYIGDRIDNDIVPAQQAGLATAFLRRGPWGFIQRDAAAEARCRFVLDDLVDLPRRIQLHNSGAH